MTKLSEFKTFLSNKIISSELIFLLYLIDKHLLSSINYKNFLITFQIDITNISQFIYGPKKISDWSCFVSIS